MTNRPQVTYNHNGEVILSTEINGLLVRMRMTADEADVLGSQIHNMASGARKQKVEIEDRSVINFDAKQVKEKGRGQQL